MSLADNRPTVEIAPGDRAFKTSGCGEWAPLSFASSAVDEWALYDMLAPAIDTVLYAIAYAVVDTIDDPDTAAALAVLRSGIRTRSGTMTTCTAIRGPSSPCSCNGLAPPWPRRQRCRDRTLEIPQIPLLNGFMSRRPHRNERGACRKMQPCNSDRIERPVANWGGAGSSPAAAAW